MIKVVFFDVDGTLLSHSQNVVPESTRRALVQLRTAGVKVVAATGRFMKELERLPVHELEFDGYLTLNGVLCLDEKKEKFYGDAIEGLNRESIVAMFEQKDFPVLLIEEERMYINYVTEKVRKAQEEVSSGIPRIGEWTGGTIYQAVIYATEEEEQALKERLPGCKITRWNKNGVDMVSKTGGKVAGIQKYLEKYEINPEETMAFGDGENDMEMLKFVNIGIAMENASEVVKKSADYVTAHIDEDGVEKALKHFGMI